MAEPPLRRSKSFKRAGEDADRNEERFTGERAGPNPSVLVHEMFELGITPELGGKQEEVATAEEAPRIIRFPGA